MIGTTAQANKQRLQRQTIRSTVITFSGGLGRFKNAAAKSPDLIIIMCYYVLSSVGDGVSAIATAAWSCCIQLDNVMTVSQDTGWFSHEPLSYFNKDFLAI